MPSSEKMWSVGLTVAALLGVFAALHVPFVLRDRSYLIVADSTFERILDTGGLYADCGRFRSLRNRETSPKGELFVIHHGRALIGEEAKDAYRSMHPGGDPDGRCWDGRRGSLFADILDPVLLPLIS